MQNNQNRIFGYDLIKTIAIFMIVFYHLGGLDYGTKAIGVYYLPNTNKFFSALCATSVPLFFMVNGALVVHRNLHWKQMVSKAFHLLFLLFFWRFVLQYLISNQLLNIQENMVHFWFLGTLSMVYIASIAFNRYIHLRYTFLFILLLFPFCYNLVWIFFLFFSPVSVFFTFTHTGFFTFYSILYFYLGDFLRVRQLRPIYSFSLIVLGLLLVNFEVVVMSNHQQIIYDGVNSSFPTFGALAMSVGIFMFLKNTNSHHCVIKKMVTFVGQNTMGIYLFHVFFIFLFYRFFSDYFSGLQPLVALLISTLIVFITAYISFLIKSHNLAFFVSLHSIRRYSLEK